MRHMSPGVDTSTQFIHSFIHVTHNYGLNTLTTHKHVNKLYAHCSHLDTNTVLMVIVMWTLESSMRMAAKHTSKINNALGDALDVFRVSNFLAWDVRLVCCMCHDYAMTM
jgi:hypothetical protein